MAEKLVLAEERQAELRNNEGEKTPAKPPGQDT
jgi:hypothetical protein